MSDRQELIRRFAVAIAGVQSAKTFDDRMSEQEIWRQAKFMASAEPPQTPVDDRIERALQLLRDAQAYDWVEADVLSEVRRILENEPTSNP